MEEQGCFLYFGFASNLKKDRLIVSAPSAELVCPAKLDGYEIVFFERGDNWWQGAMASIRKKEGKSIWGAVWRIKNEEESVLDQQEGADTGMLGKLNVQVTDETGKKFQCSCYYINNKFPIGLPSPYYLSTIQEGAQEVGLPFEYRQRLKDVQHNGRYKEDHSNYPQLNFNK